MSSPVVTVSALAVGGDGVARDDSGRVVFVTGGLPGETVQVHLLDEHTRFAHSVVERVIAGAPQRREAPCPHVARGCGGCGWQHVEPEAQRTLKVAMVKEALSRVGHVSDPAVHQGAPLADQGFRSTLRVLVEHGRPGFRRDRSHDAVSVDSCLVADPRLEELLAEASFGAAHEVVLRIGAGTGERMAIASPTAEGLVMPADVVVVGADEVAAGRHAWIYDEVAGRRWRVSAQSFFQTRPDGAEALVAAVVGSADALRTHDSDRSTRVRTVVDLCCGVGLLGGTFVDQMRASGEEWRLLGVERSRSSVADARHNLADLEGVKIVRASMESWRPSPADLLIADPARSGLGKQGVARVAATGAGSVVLVSCDAGSLGRDAGLLQGVGYRFVEAQLVDMFPHTPHVEVVSRFTRTA